MSDWRERLTTKLEPLLVRDDPRQAISAYHDMLYAIFRYPPEAEFEVRRELSLLRTRLEQRGKRVTTVSLAECLHAACKTGRSIICIISGVSGQQGQYSKREGKGSRKLSSGIAGCWQLVQRALIHALHLRLLRPPATFPPGCA